MVYNCILTIFPYWTFWMNMKGFLKNLNLVGLHCLNRACIFHFRPIIINTHMIIMKFHFKTLDVTYLLEILRETNTKRPPKHFYIYILTSSLDFYFAIWKTREHEFKMLNVRNKSGNHFIFCFHHFKQQFKESNTFMIHEFTYRSSSKDLP